MLDQGKMPWLRIFGWAFLIHVILIAITVLEVFIYSLIKPGQEESFYSHHAEISGPIISMVVGFVLFFFIARYLGKNRSSISIRIGILLAVIYTIMDALILLGYSIDWSDHLPVFAISFLVKLSGGYLGGRAAGGISPQPDSF